MHLCWPIADAAQCGAPPAVVRKILGRETSPHPIAAPYEE